ncbi:hypothetical protein Agabi119p4_2371 [Agaricus bisporus var. burnettii]|uniref:Uncharacterized protein n=1 Tax=Agaricus bisporus var. burnettii TaxID=192524 RepID=A0A8H7F970_AGABI|nr:hypothetical protein Agabi119p4_2371 [Agaricus bisporus var. burnettii]
MLHCAFKSKSPSSKFWKSFAPFSRGGILCSDKVKEKITIIFTDRHWKCTVSSLVQRARSSSDNLGPASPKPLLMIVNIVAQCDSNP